jgi:DNA replication protein DnaC
MTMVSDQRGELTRCLKELHLPTVRECYEEQAELARRESLSYEHYLLELMEREREERRHRRIARLLRESKLPLEKSLEAFDMKRLPRKVITQVKALLEGSFMDRAENVLAFGNPGSGKTHLLCAIGQEMIYQGRRVLFTPCNLLVQELLIAKRELELKRILKRLTKYDALIIDDLGYVQQNREEMEVLFALLADRYERRSVMLTSNLPFSQWERIFKDPMTTAAAIDRLVHHSVILELNLSSYRLEESKKRKGGTQKTESKKNSQTTKVNKKEKETKREL